MTNLAPRRPRWRWPPAIAASRVTSTMWMRGIGGVGSIRSKARCDAFDARSARWQPAAASSLTAAPRAPPPADLPTGRPKCAAPRGEAAVAEIPDQAPRLDAVDDDPRVAAVRPAA